MPTSSNAASGASIKYQNLLLWCRSSGAIIPDTFILSSNLTGGHCLTTKEIPAGEPIFQIPRNLCITPAIATATFPVLETTSVHTQLCCFLSLERGKEGFWKPYLDSLPETFTTPAYFTDNELGILKGTNISFVVQERLNLWKREYEDIKALLPEVSWYFPPPYYLNLIFQERLLMVRNSPFLSFFSLTIIIE